MDEGLIFWLIIIAVAVLQGVGRKKRKAAQLAQKPPGSPGPRTDSPGAQGRLEASSRPTMASLDPGQDAAEKRSPEGPVPADVWAEILGLARGETRQAGPGVPHPSEAEPAGGTGEEEPGEELPREERPREERPAAAVATRKGRQPPVVRSFPTSHGADAVLHQTKTGDFESRLIASRTPTPGSEPGKGRGVRAGLFGSGSPRDLRKAIILREVLGSPLGLREEGE